MVRKHETEADKILDRMAALSDSDLRNMIGIAQEYRDHPDVASVSGLQAGQRLGILITHALDEIESVAVARQAREE